MKSFDASELFSRCAPIPEAGCWVWVGNSTSRGYGSIPCVIDGKKTSVLASRAMYSAVHGQIPDGAFVCHKCDTPPCINPDHLFIGSPLDNVVDMMKKGRSKKSYGEYNSRCKLTEADVLAILRDRRVAREISADYGISKTAVYAIRSGTCWDYLTKDLREAMTP